MNAFEILMMTSKYSNKRIYKRCIQVANSLQGKLPYSPHHPYGRNENAHVFQMIKSKFGCSYKSVTNKEKLWEYLQWIELNPC